jgi:outer membrane protein assembly factor BamD (BamD/ComL family)
MPLQKRRKKATIRTLTNNSADGILRTLMPRDSAVPHRAAAAVISRDLFATVFAIAVAIFLLAFSRPVFADEENLAAQVRSHFQVGRYEAGVKALDEFRKKYKDSSLLPELELLQAQSCRNSFDALKLFAAFEEKYPASPLAAQALLESAKLHLLIGDANSALREAQLCRDRHPGSDSLDSVYLLLGQVNAGMGRHTAAANEFASLLARYPASPLAPKAMVGLADARHQSDKLDAAAEMYLKALDTKTSDLDIGRIYYSLGQIAERRNQKTESVRYYRVVTEKLPTSFYAQAATERLKDLAGSPETPLPRESVAEEYSIALGTFESSNWETETAPYVKAGFQITTRPAADGKIEVLTGSFTTRIQAEFFAEELQKKFEKTYTVVRIK